MSTINYSPSWNLFRRVKFSAALLSTLLAGFIFVSPTPSLAATLQACTSAELSAAVTNARAGDEVIMCNKIWKDVQIAFSVKGTISAPVTLRAATPGQVQLTGSSTLQMAGTYAVVDGLVFKGAYTGSDIRVIQFKDSRSKCNHCRLTNSAFIGYNPASNNTLVYWVAVYGQYNRIDHNYFSGKTGEGAFLQVLHGSSPDYHRIDNNYFGDRPDNKLGMGNALQIGTTGKTAYIDSLTTVERNLFYEADGDSELISNKSSGNTYQYNTFIASRGQLTLRQGNNVLVNDNFFFGNGKIASGGIRVNGEGHTIINNYMDGVNPTSFGERGGIILNNGDSKIDPTRGWYHYPRVRNVTIAFNTIVNSGNSLYLGKVGNIASSVSYKQVVPPDNITIANNVVYSSKAPLILEKTKMTKSTYSDNIISGASLGISKPNGISTVNPELAVASDGLYRPLEGSPVKDAVLDSSTNITFDMDGQKRQLPFDIGADEQTANLTVTRRPLTRCDVGPLTFNPTNNNCQDSRIGSLVAPPVAPAWL